jgi:hypothetical protein
MVPPLFIPDFETDRNSSEFKNLKSAITQLPSGITSLIKKVAKTIFNYPLESATLSGSLILTHSLVNDDTAVILGSLLAVTNIVKNGKKFIVLANSTTFSSSKATNSILRKACIVTIIAACVYGFSTLPIASAYIPCSPSSDKAIDLARQCFAKGGDLKQCFGLVTKEGFSKFGCEYTHHVSAVSKIEIETQKICFSMALKDAPNGTKICFQDLETLESPTLESFPAEELIAEFDDINQGESYREIAALGNTICRTFSTIVAPDVIPDQAICILSPTGAEVMQTCFNPRTPSRITVKSLEKVYLVYPRSVITKAPLELGFDPTIEKSECYPINPGD